MNGYKHATPGFTEEDRTLLLRLSDVTVAVAETFAGRSLRPIIDRLRAARKGYVKEHWPFDNPIDNSTDPDAVLSRVEADAREEELDPFVVQEADKPTSDRAVAWRWDEVARIESRNEGNRTMLFFKSGGSCTVPMPFMEARAWFTGKKSGSFGEHIS